MTVTSSSDKIKTFNGIPEGKPGDHKDDPVDTFVVYTRNADQFNTGELVRYSFYEATKRVARDVAVIKGFVPGTERAEEAEMKKSPQDKQMTPDNKQGKDKKKKKKSVLDKVKEMVTK